MLYQKNGGMTLEFSIFDSFQNLIILLDTHHTVVFLNEKAKKTFGELTGSSFPYPQLLPYTLSNAYGDMVIQDCFFHYRWTQLNETVYLGEWIDMTTQKNLELQFIRSQRMESLGLLASGIVHDLNNMLSPIFMGVGFLKNNLVDSKSLTVLKLLESSAKRVSKLSKQILAFAKGTDKKTNIVCMTSILNDLKEFIFKTFPKNISLDHDPVPENCHVQGNATQLFQVFLNLAMNAKDAMPNGGLIRIKVVKKDSMLIFLFSDSGTGIQEAILSNIFKPFFTTKKPELGTGMGLSAVDTIVKNHKGKIEVKSVLNQGTTFSISFPLTPSDTSTPRSSFFYQKKTETPLGV